MIFINIRVKNLTLHEKNAESCKNCMKLMQNFAKLAHVLPHLKYFLIILLCRRRYIPPAQLCVHYRYKSVLLTNLLLAYPSANCSNSTLLLCKDLCCSYCYTVPDNA